jgi:hypothetical protein
MRPSLHHCTASSLGARTLPAYQPGHEDSTSPLHHGHAHGATPVTSLPGLGRHRPLVDPLLLRRRDCSPYRVPYLSPICETARPAQRPQRAWAGGSTSPQESAGGSTSPQESAGGSTSPQESAGGSTSPQESAGGSTSWRQHVPTGIGWRQHVPTGIGWRQHVPTGIGWRQHVPTGIGLHKRPAPLRDRPRKGPCPPQADSDPKVVHGSTRTRSWSQPAQGTR